MPTKTLPMLAGLCASAVLAQQLERVVHLTPVETEQQLQEIATNLRGITEIPQVSVDSAQKSLTLHGTAAQIAAAEWLLGQWNSSGPSRQDQENAAARQYRLSSEDIVRVFRLAHAPTPRALQEVATIVRSIADIRRLFTYNAPSVMTVRGDAARIALAEWLVNQLDQPVDRANRSAASGEYHAGGAADDVVRVFYPAHTGTPQGLEEIATDVRAIGDIGRLFTRSDPAALIVRGTSAQLALAEWLLGQLDQPADQAGRTSAPHEYRPSGTADDVVRVFFLPFAESPQRLQQIAAEVRSTTQVRRIFTYNAPRAMTLRGTAAQIAMAERLVSERDR
ncbi:MAG TPA: hypothetical protein VL285_09880 [Bryobacteraceae bacterium]|jgi:hypothetical protein|nr:hypothetical protein [Bryobacteraceae bacterium]